VERLAAQGYQRLGENERRVMEALAATDSSYLMNHRDNCSESPAVRTIRAIMLIRPERIIYSQSKKNKYINTKTKRLCTHVRLIIRAIIAKATPIIRNNSKSKIGEIHSVSYQMARLLNRQNNHSYFFNASKVVPSTIPVMSPNQTVVRIIFLALFEKEFLVMSILI